MIHNSNITVSTPVQDAQAGQFSTAKPRLREGAAPKTAEVQPSATNPSENAIPSATSTGPVSVIAKENLKAASSPIEDKAQASEATQHARALILAHPRAAILAQPNSKPQSALRLLQ